MTVGGSLLVVGSASGVGKSTFTAGLCRLLARRGQQIAPFKAQNMSNHAAVTADGGEVGRAQAVQALAARVDVERRMNPVLLKPTADGRSHVVVMGDEVGTTDAVAYGPQARDLRGTVLDAFTSLRDDHDWVIAEGAGGAAEINLLERDLVNLPLAHAAGIPAIVVVDIDRGGAFASAFGTIELLPKHLRTTIGGVVFNRFRGDISLLDSGIDDLEARTGVPVLGVLPHLGNAPMFGVEDSLDLDAPQRVKTRSARPVRVAAIRLPHLANPSDLDPMLAEPDVELTWVTRTGQLADADLIVLPGSRATVVDLGWLREVGLADAITSSAAQVVGICAGYQMLGTTIEDGIESCQGRIDGLGLLSVETTFAEPKVVSRRRGTADGRPVAGYEIRFGRPVTSGAAWLCLDGEPEGAVSADGRVRGTSLHGIFDSDAFRIDLLRRAARRSDRSYSPPLVGFAEQVDTQLDGLADWLEAHLDCEATLDLARTASPAGSGPGW